MGAKDAKTEENGFIKYATGAPIELEDTDTTFNPIAWWISKSLYLSYPLPIRPRYLILPCNVD